MKYLAHVAGGAIAAMAVAGPALASHRPELAIAVEGAGALIGPVPDVDVRWNKIGRRWINWRSPWLKHRGPTHSLGAAAIVAIALGMAAGAFQPSWAAPMALGVFLAYLSHIALDLVNPSSVWVLCPFRSHWRNRHGWAEGTPRESFAEVAVVALAVGLLWLTVAHVFYPEFL